MRMAVQNKICSRKGASITFALLAFLICAVIGAVVLSAAMTTSGRASGIAEMDQRYYAVSSAAQLFRDAINEQEFTVERIEQETYIDVWSYKPVSSAEAGDDVGDDVGEDVGEDDGGEGGDDAGGESAEGSGEDYSRIESEHVSSEEYSDYTLNITMPDDSVETFLWLGKPLDEEYEPDTLNDFREASVLNNALLTFVCGAANNAFEAYPVVPGAFTEDEDSPWYEAREFQMTFTESESNRLSEEDLNALEVKVSIEMRKDGALIITFSNVPGADSSEVYKLKLTMVAKVTDDSLNPATIKKTGVGVESGPNDSYTETTTTVTTRTKKTTIVWHVSDVMRVN